MVGSTPTIAGLSERLDRLERENRRLKLAGILALAGISAVVLMGQARTGGKVVEAEKFLLRDARAKVRAELRADGDEPELVLLDRNENSRVRLRLEADGRPALVLYGKNNIPSATLGLLGDGWPALVLFGKDGEGSASLEVSPLVSAALHLSDRALKNRIQLLVDREGKPSLSLLDSDKKSRAVLGHTELETSRTGTVEQRPASSLVLFDKDGKVIWRAP